MRIQKLGIRGHAIKDLAGLKIGLSLISLWVSMIVVGQSSDHDSVISAFLDIEETPTIVSFRNDKEVNNEGGHLQGVQMIAGESCNYVILTGSSDTYAYYAVVRLGETNEVILVNRLMDKPFKHAGGFQVFKNYLAVGIEDNAKKDKSKVCIYDVSIPENPSLDPIAVIERAGSPMRSTAGCIGFIAYPDETLLIVGDWNTRNIDFYSCDFSGIESNGFELVYSMEPDRTSKKGWIDHNWHAYQNINLIRNHQNTYLIGLGQNGKNEDIADLYSVQKAGTNDFQLTKLATKTFNCEDGASFKAGAGAFWNDQGGLRVISCGYHIGNMTYLNYFRSHK